MSRSSIAACCPICFARGRGWSPKARLEPDGVFAASTVLAKHDERYMPREVVDALKKSGHWQDGAASRGAAAPLTAAAPLPTAANFAR